MATKEETKGKTASQILHEMCTIIDGDKLRILFLDCIPPAHILHQNCIVSKMVGRDSKSTPTEKQQSLNSGFLGLGTIDIWDPSFFVVGVGAVYCGVFSSILVSTH